MKRAILFPLVPCALITMAPGECNPPKTGDTAVRTDCDYDTGDTAALVDADDDGFTVCYDPDDTNAAVYPGADEVCDGVDNNGDGLTDNTSTALACAKYDPATDSCTPVYICKETTGADVSNGFFVGDGLWEPCPTDYLTMEDCLMLAGPLEAETPAEVKKEVQRRW